FPFAAANLKQRIVGSGAYVGRIEEKNTAMPCAEAAGELPVLALDVVNDGRARPGEQRGHNEADALAGSRRCEAQHMLRAVMAQIVAIKFSEDHTVGPQKPSLLNIWPLVPSRRTIGVDVVRLAFAQDRHSDSERHK